MTVNLAQAVEESRAALPLGMGETFGTMLLGALGALLVMVTVILVIAQLRGMSKEQRNMALALQGGGLLCFAGVFTAPLGVILCIACLGYLLFAPPHKTVAGK